MEFLPLFLVLLAGVLFSALGRRFHLPWVIALVSAGIFFGPHGLGVLEANPTIEFIGQIGLIFLMFMAGLETKLSSFAHVRSGFVPIAFLNGLVPFAAGFGMGFFFGYDFFTSLILGTVFISSSIAVVIPTLEGRGMLGTKLGKSIVSAVIIEDILSLILLSILLQTAVPVTSLPLPLFYGLLFAVFVALRFLLPLLRAFFSPRRSGGEEDIFQQEVTVIFAILIGTVVSFELLGLHPIVAGFFAGLVLSGSIKSDILVEKLHTISYGLFIPVFFIFIGLNTDLSVLREGGELTLLLFVVLGSILAKYISGYIGARLGKFTKRESSIVGVATIPQLSTTLAVVFAAVEFGLLERELLTAFIVLSIVTTFAAPVALRLLTKPTAAH
ncbi:hypothetical protein COU17_01225 [Candidatus Kaiserbacteria bacterium CG10_big_fil_rev_8_21_14_0_10_49_17]|uniref:Cation/H+ exchanger transmembrane domain-containing protein n=1 Tax=Candidatus Kaiserbacteria bacterium CG10_big_fil_rev_8_21_14_0_10_49_17 TaxID=1974609 RepID=A0A2M6WEK3_9BACT|nr:MAG: hypothetical protein COU17_01225 [Candidatus Kaiserbacteria bacterium CG10_big_fil_rev_8_21_14_0_10_49_17]